MAPRKTKERSCKLLVDEKGNLRVENTQFNDYEMIGLLDVARDTYKGRFNKLEDNPNGTPGAK